MRDVIAGSLVYDQLDFYNPPGSSARVAGVGAASLSARVFRSNAAAQWDVVDGLQVPDLGVATGHLYFNEIPGSPGYYSLRFLPDVVGYWRIAVTYAGAEQLREYSVVPAPPAPDGLSATTV